MTLSSLEGRTIAGYALEQEIGRGAMGVVYRARDTRHDRDVALKILDPDIATGVSSERFLREIRTVARLAHPHIVPLYDSGDADGLLFYVMPFIEGSTLRQRMNAFGKVDTAEAIRITQQVASALDYAHRLGIVHRDIKPDNVMLHQGEAVVTDFGIAKALTVAAADNLTRTGTSLGTPTYMSPEQALASDDVDARSDQYSLGCVLYEMLSGSPPFTGQSAQAVIAKRFVDIPKPIRAASVPEFVSRAVSQSLERDPSSRFPTIAEFSDALSASAKPLLSGAGPTGRRSIAVLPFANMSADPDNEYFTAGIAEEIMNSLTKVSALAVASRTSAFAFKGTKDDVREIGRKLDVSTLLEGSVRKSGRHLRVQAQLIDVDSGYHLWSERYDRELADVFAIQDEIAENIVKALQVVLTPDEAQAVKVVPASDVRAYEYYLRGRQLLFQHRKAGHDEAIKWYRRAIEIDPGYALAFAGIAYSSSLLYMYREATQENLLRTEDSSGRALELNPNLPEAHVACGLALWLRQRWSQAAEAFERALQLDPRNFDAAYFHGRASFAHGVFEKAAEMFSLAADCRPDDYQANSMRIMALQKLGRLDEAREAAAATVVAVERRLAIDPGETRALYLGAGALFQIGQRDRAFEWAARAVGIDPNEVSTWYNIGCLYANAGEKERALDHLDQAVRRGFAQREWIENDPDWEPVRNDPRFHEIVSRAGPVAASLSTE